MAEALNKGMHFAGMDAHRPLTERQRSVVHGLARREWALMSHEQPLPVRAEECTTMDAAHLRMLAPLARGEDSAVGHKIHGSAERVLTFVAQTQVRCIWLIRDARDVMLSRWFRGDDMLDAPLVERMLDEAAIERWKRHMHRPLVRYATWACSQELEAWGYDTRLEPPLMRNETRRFRMRCLSFQAARAAGHLRQWATRRLFPPLGE